MAAAPKLLLVGGGHAMLPTLCAAREWTRQGVDVTLVDAHRHLYYSGMIPEYLGGVYSEDEVRIDLADLAIRNGVTFVEAWATALDSTQRVVHLDEGRALSYDLAAFDIGARTPAAPGDAYQTKPLHALRVLAHRLARLIEQSTDPVHLAVAGGGAAGVEIALNLSARYASAPLQLTLVEPAPSLLPGFPDGAQSLVRELLVRRGVDVRLGVMLEDITDKRQRLSDGSTLRADLVLWATGTTGHRLFRDAGLPCDAAGFVRVDASLRCLADPVLFAAGDCASVRGLERLPKIGVHAVKQGPVLRDNLDVALTRHRRGEPTRPDDLASFEPYPLAPLILSTGTADGIWVGGKRWIHGKPLLRLKHFVDQRWIRQYSPAWRGTALWQMWDAASADHA